MGIMLYSLLWLKQPYAIILPLVTLNSEPCTLDPVPKDPRDLYSLGCKGYNIV